MLLSAEIGTSFADFGWKLSILYVDPRPWYPQISGLLGRMPWVALGLAGALFALIRQDDARRRGYVACLLLAAAAYITVLTAYADFLPSGLWRNANIHYLKWILPLLGMLAWLLVRDGRRAPGRAFAAMAAIFLATGLRLIASAGAGTGGCVAARPARAARCGAGASLRRAVEHRGFAGKPSQHLRIPPDHGRTGGACDLGEAALCARCLMGAAGRGRPILAAEQFGRGALARTGAHGAGLPLEDATDLGLPCWLGACPTAP